jgi:hypothetical protein
MKYQDTEAGTVFYHHVQSCCSRFCFRCKGAIRVEQVEYIKYIDVNKMWIVEYQMG